MLTKYRGAKDKHRMGCYPIGPEGSPDVCVHLSGSEDTLFIQESRAASVKGTPTTETFHPACLL